MENTSNLTNGLNQNNNLEDKQAGTENQTKLVFALDIGTRCIVGIVGFFKDDKFNVVDYEQQFHQQRNMKDGQIENIEQVAKIVNNVKLTLENRLGQPLKKVAIAAAGRSLKTVRTTYEQTIDPNEEITGKQIHSLEYSAVGNALEEFKNETQKNSYYCVGYSVTNYFLDDYAFSSLQGHKGTNVKIDLIAAFLPHNVIESLYTVTKLCDLEVVNLTLEPIAAINVIVPKDIRLLNIALVDIGAGTSDIAISKNGGIVAYDMATIAGDEITEAIMNTYITDFETAESIKIKLEPNADIIEFADILGNQYRLTPEEIYNVIKPAVEALGNCIAQRILDINTTPPVAIFLVGGGSQVYNLTKIIANKLNMPEARVAVGGRQPHKHINLCSIDLLSPEYITPIGIGAVASMYDGCDFFSITVNDYKIMLLNHNNTKVLDALLLAGIKPSNLIGISPRPIAYTLNGAKQILRGTASIPGEIYINDKLASIDSEIKQGDVIRTVLPKNGQPPQATMAEIMQDYPPLTIIINEQLMDIQPYFTVNSVPEDSSYQINNLDEIEILNYTTVKEIANFMGLDLEEYTILINNQPGDPEQQIHAGDILTTVKINEMLNKTTPEVNVQPQEDLQAQPSNQVNATDLNNQTTPQVNVQPQDDLQSPLSNQANAADFSLNTFTQAVENDMNLNNVSAVDSGFKETNIFQPAASQTVDFSAEDPIWQINTTLNNAMPAENQANAAQAPQVENPFRPTPPSVQPQPQPQPEPQKENYGFNPDLYTQAAKSTTEDLSAKLAESTDDVSWHNTEFFDFNSALAQPPVSKPNHIKVLINDKWTNIPLADKKYINFVDTLNYVEIDTKNPQGDLLIQLNGRNAAFMDIVQDGDKVEIGWSK